MVQTEMPSGHKLIMVVMPKSLSSFCVRVPGFGIHSGIWFRISIFAKWMLLLGLRNSPLCCYRPAMVWITFGILSLACGLMMLIERSGIRTTLVLNFKGDVKRETRWIAQYGQALCTAVAAVLVLQLDSNGKKSVIPLLVATFGVSAFATVIKRLTGRVRPNREDAGKFFGPSLKHTNARESFPSSHSANAVAMSAVLAMHYPAAAPTFWTLAIACACLRYVLDAHWPSDVLGGIALGYLSAVLSVRFFG
jgi:membrane-associated phospholipid phosphatase